MKMMRFRSLSIIGAFCLVLLIANQGVCGLVLTEGESYAFEFTSLSYHSEYSEELFLHGMVTLASATSTAPSFIFSLYEDSIGEAPFRSGTHGIDPDFGMQSIGYLEYTGSAFWKDFQGIFGIEIIAGTVEIESFMASTITNNRLFRQTFAVPIPSSFIFVLLGLLTIYIVHAFKRNGIKAFV